MSTSLFDRAEEVDALRAAVAAVAEGRGGVKAVESHMGQAYRKLDSSGRAELAPLLVQPTSTP